MGCRCPWPSLIFLLRDSKEGETEFIVAVTQMQRDEDGRDENDII